MALQGEGEDEERKTCEGGGKLKEDTKNEKNEKIKNERKGERRRGKEKEDR